MIEFPQYSLGYSIRTASSINQPLLIWFPIIIIRVRAQSSTIWNCTSVSPSHLSVDVIMWSLTMYLPFPAESHFYTSVWCHPFTVRNVFIEHFQETPTTSFVLDNFSWWHKSPVIHSWLPGSSCENPLTFVCVEDLNK